MKSQSCSIICASGFFCTLERAHPAALVGSGIPDLCSVGAPAKKQNS
jgi:hypothetical protein